VFEDFDISTESVSGEEAFEMLQELERNRSDEIRRQRVHFRLAVKAGVILQPGNASDLLKFKVKGVTGDVSQGGCSALFPIPIHVGDIYRMQFDRKMLDLPLTFVRCVRCRLVREDSFEAGFTFFSPITIPEKASYEGESTLVI